VRLKKLSYLAAAAAVGAGLVLVGATPALAAAPTNDSFAGAVAIGSLPFTATVDTTQATTDADDVSANVDCGAPATDASVWYSYTAAEDAAILVDVAKSSYSAGVLVVTGAPGAFQLVACGPQTVGFPVVAGQTYYLMMIDDQSDGSGNGGQLALTVDIAPPTPTITATVDPTGSFNSKTGSATVHGTFTCSGAADYAEVDIELHQQVGRGEVVGYSYVEITCDADTHPWSLEVVPTVGTKFAGGKAASLTFTVACGVLDCSTDYQERVVQLSKHG
jgi:hypothetical protein